MSRVLTLGLSDEVSLLLIDEGDGWRFGQWSRVTDGIPLPAPPIEATAQRFTELDAARLFFRLMLLEHRRDQLQNERAARLSNSAPAARERRMAEDEPES